MNSLPAGYFVGVSGCIEQADIRTGSFQHTGGANVSLLNTSGDTHEITSRQRIHVRELLMGESVRAGQSGFLNTFETEALPGALPADQNSPHQTKYGLYPEQINATGFVAKRNDNRRAWAYKIRPSAQHTNLELLAHATFRCDFDVSQPEPNLTGWKP